MSLLFSGIKLTEISQKRLGFFLKIEEIQLPTFIVLANYSKADLMLDIGANVGFYTLVVKKYLKGIECFAYEPTPDTFRDLQKNIHELNTLSSVSAFNMVISSTPNELEFNDFGNCSGKNSVVSTTIHGEKNLQEKITVKADTLDRLHNHTGRRCMLKIDTEGHELEILKGSSRFLNNNQCVIQVEAGHTQNSQIETFLNGAGYYKMFSLGPDQYFTNIPELLNESTLKSLLEESLNFVIGLRWNKDKNFIQNMSEGV